MTANLPTKVGSFELVRRLRDSQHGERFVAVDRRTNANATVHRLEVGRDGAERRRTLEAVERLGKLRHSHLLPMFSHTLGAAGELWIVTPFTGNHEGLVLLSDLVELRQASLSAMEAGRAIEQLLEAAATAHDAGVHHGPLDLSEIQIDRSGSLYVEFFGLARLREGLGPANDLLIRDEIRSLVALGYQLFTGLSAEEPRIRASRLVKRLDRGWDSWIEEGLDPFGGFGTAAEALAALPGQRLAPAAGPIGLPADHAGHGGHAGHAGNGVEVSAAARAQAR